MGVLTNHLKRPWLDRDDMLYQTSNEVTPKSLVDENSPTDTQLESLSAGDVIIFDDRILHRGLSNTSETERWVGYFSYTRPRPGTIENTYFEATQSLFQQQ